MCRWTPAPARKCTCCHESSQRLRRACGGGRGGCFASGCWPHIRRTGSKSAPHPAIRPAAGASPWVSTVRPSLTSAAPTSTLALCASWNPLSTAMCVDQLRRQRLEPQAPPVLLRMPECPCLSHFNHPFSRPPAQVCATTPTLNLTATSSSLVPSESDPGTFDLLRFADVSSAGAGTVRECPKTVRGAHTSGAWDWLCWLLVR